VTPGNISRTAGGEDFRHVAGRLPGTGRAESGPPSLAWSTWLWLSPSHTSPISSGWISG